MTDQPLTHEQITRDVLALLQTKLKEVDTDYAGEVTAATYVVKDLEFESVNIVELCMAIGKHFKKKLPFQDLVFRDGKFQDFSVADMVKFLESKLATS